MSGLNFTPWHIRLFCEPWHHQHDHNVGSPVYKLPFYKLCWLVFSFCTGLDHIAVATADFDVNMYVVFLMISCCMFVSSDKWHATRATAYTTYHIVHIMVWESLKERPTLNYLSRTWTGEGIQMSIHTAAYNQLIVDICTKLGIERMLLKGLSDVWALYTLS